MREHLASAQLEAHPQSALPQTRRSTISPIRSHGESLAKMHCFERGVAWYKQFPASPERLSAAESFVRPISYRRKRDQDRRLSAGHQTAGLPAPPVEMIYSWYGYAENAVIASLLNPLRDDGKSVSPRLGMLRAPPQAISRPISCEKHFGRSNSTLSGAIPDRVRQGVYEFLGVAADFRRQAEEGEPARAPRFPILQSGAQRLYAGISAIPGVGKLLKSAGDRQRSRHLSPAEH